MVLTPENAELIRHATIVGLEAFVDEKLAVCAKTKNPPYTVYLPTGTGNDIASVIIKNYEARGWGVDVAMNDNISDPWALNFSYPLK